MGVTMDTKDPTTNLESHTSANPKPKPKPKKKKKHNSSFVHHTSHPRLAFFIPKNRVNRQNGGLKPSIKNKNTLGRTEGRSEIHSPKKLTKHSVHRTGRRFFSGLSLCRMTSTR